MNFATFKRNFYFKVLPYKDTNLRNGQKLMIYLNDIWKEEYLRLSSVHYYDAKNIDCFYNDKLINNTFTHLEKEWKNYPN